MTEIKLANFENDISLIDFSDDSQCNNCKGEPIGSIDITPTEYSYNNYIRFHGQLVRVNILKGNKND